MAKNLILWLVIAVVLMSVFQSFSPSDTDRTPDWTIPASLKKYPRADP
jgi:hypothetical protein